MRARRTAAAAAAAMAIGTLAVTAQPPAATAAPKRPDLVTSKISTPPKSVRYGSTFGLGAIVANRGTAPAAHSTLRIYLSKDKSVGAGDILGASVKVKKVPAGKRKTVSGRITVPPDARGSYWAIACADSTKKVAESKEGNNCRVAKSPLEIDASIDARLSGTLTFTDNGDTDDGDGRTETWRRTATANVAIAVTGDPSDRTFFTSTGSTYERQGTRVTQRRNVDCFTEITRTESGSGGLSDYSSEISGHFTRTDMSGVSLGLQIPATWTQTETRTPQRENGCVEYGTTTMGKDIVAHAIELQEISATENAITYEVVGWTADMGMESDWEELTGQLVLRLK